MKTMLGFGMLLLVLATSFAGAWHEPEAHFRLTLEAQNEQTPLYFDFSEWLLPETPSGGFAVTGEDGRAIGFEYTGAGRILIDPAPGRVRYLYWGLPATKGRASGQKLDRLHLRIVSGYNLFPTAGEWLANRNRGTNRNYQRQWERNQQALEQCLFAYMFYPTFFMQHNPEIWVVRNQVFQARRFAEMVRQNQVVGRRRLHRPRCGSDAPFWFWPLQRKYLYERILGTMRNYRYINERWKKNLNENLKNSVGAPERELVDRVANKRSRLQGEGAVREIVLPKRPFDSGGDFLTRFSGNLQIAQAGDYEFTITSNATILWKINGKVVLRHFGRTDPRDVRPATVKLPLKAGAHEFELIYHKWKVTTDLTVTWRGPGEKEFRLLDDTAFAPAPEAKVAALEDCKGTGYFRMRRRSRYLLSLDKDARAELVEFIPETAGGFRWKLPDGSTSPEKQRVLALRTAGEAERAELIPDDARLPRMALGEYREPETPFLALDPEIDFSLELPRVLFQNENMEYRVRFFSDLPVAANYLWETETSRELNSFPAERRSVSLGAKNRSERFAVGTAVERTGDLAGHELADGAVVTMRFGLPGMALLEKGVRFAPVSAMPEDWRSIGGEWLDDDGNRVVPVVNRMSLHQLRSWELPQRLWTKFRPAGYVVVAPDFGNLREKLRQTAETRGETLTFVPWEEKGEGGNVWLDSLPLMWEKLGTVDAARAVVVLPTEYPEILAEWERERMVAMLLNRLRQNRAIKEIYLTTAIPRDGFAGDKPWYPQGVAREYEAKRLYWWDKLSSDVGVGDYYREEQMPEVERSCYPGRATDALAEKFWTMF